jgi:hypothetical protein
MFKRVVGKDQRTAREIRWSYFWIVEVLILSVPQLIAVFTIRREGRLKLAETVSMGVIQVCLTVVNLIWVFSHRTTNSWGVKGKKR